MSITLFIKAKHVSYAMYSFKSMSYAVVCFTVQIYNPPTAYMHCSALPASDCSTRRYFSRQKKKKKVVENCMKNSCWYHLRCVDDSRRSKPCLVLIINIFWFLPLQRATLSIKSVRQILGPETCSSGVLVQLFWHGVRSFNVIPM